MAAPCFRVFNPALQGKKHDPDGRHVRRWVPEADRVPGNYIREPRGMPVEVQQKASCAIG